MKSIDVSFCSKNNKPTLVIRYYKTKHNDQRMLEGLNPRDNAKIKFYSKYQHEIEKIEVRTFDFEWQRENYLTVIAPFINKINDDIEYEYCIRTGSWETK